MEEQTILDELNELQKFRKTETKVNKELHAYLTQTINNAEVEILAWSSRYNDEMEKRQQEMTDLKVFFAFFFNSHKYYTFIYFYRKKL